MIVSPLGQTLCLIVRKKKKVKKLRNGVEDQLCLLKKTKTTKYITSDSLVVGAL